MTAIALTGATGFVGGHVLARAVERGLAVRALTRRPQAPRAGVEWVPGALDDAASLAALVAGAEAVIHVAGLLKAPGRAGFLAVNVAGTERLITAIKGSRARRLIHVSTLAAREPDLSHYGGSKSLAERVVEASGLDWTIIRPPAVYGPGDRETLELFRMASRGLMLLPPAGRFSVIHVADLAELLLACLDAPASIGQIYEPDDGTHRGWDHEDFADALGRAVGRRVRTVSIPNLAMRAAARLDSLARGDKAKLTPDRGRYFGHPDWVSREAFQPPAGLWRPQILTEAGLRETAAWYRREGWLG